MATDKISLRVNYGGLEISAQCQKFGNTCDLHPYSFLSLFFLETYIHVTGSKVHSRSEVFHPAKFPKGLNKILSVIASGVGISVLFLLP